MMTVLVINGSARIFFNMGFQQLGRLSMASVIFYGSGSESQNLPVCIYLVLITKLSVTIFRDLIFNLQELILFL
jgi:hypothetical protein